MAKIGEAELKNQIKNNDFSNVYMIYGDEGYLKEFYVKRLKEKLVESAFADFNYHHYDGKKTPLSEILTDADMMPMMSSNTFLLVRDYPFDKSKEDVELLKEYLKDVNEAAVIVFWFDNLEIDIKKNSKLKALEAAVSKYGTAVELNRKTESELVRLVSSKVKKSGCTIDSANAQYLISVVGNDLKTILNETEKICNSLDGGEITRKTIDSLAVKCLQARVYDL